MYILGDLIRLSQSDGYIPLPWWHRSPLAFESNTTVTVALTKSANERPGDLLLSVVNPNEWHDCYRVRCLHADTPGVIAKAFRLTTASYWNVALAETVTTEGGQQHALELVCEPKESRTAEIGTLLDQLKAEGFFDVIAEPLLGPKPGIAWHELGEVRNGWLANHRGNPLEWQTAVLKQLADLGSADKFDLTHLVVYADTEKRCLRIMFPRIGVQNVTIQHADRVGALHTLTSAIQSAGFNVLTSLLKRGGVIKGNAVLVAICEPSSETANLGLGSTELKGRLLDSIGEVDQMLRVRTHISDGRSGVDSLYLRRPDEIACRIPPHLMPQVTAKRRDRKRNQRSVFTAYRFVGDHPSEFVKRVWRTLEEMGVKVVHSPVSGSWLETSFEEVSSSMWASDAAIIIVTKPVSDKEPAMSYNLSHEFGFFQGQGKPILLLVEDDALAQKDLDSFTNAKGIQTKRFDPLCAPDSDRPTSIETIVKNWNANPRKIDY